MTEPDPNQSHVPAYFLNVPSSFVFIPVLQKLLRDEQRELWAEQANSYVMGGL
jgi:hypothetical protein